MQGSEAWAAAAVALGTTDSERILSRLAKRTFLSMWSYVNVFRDAGQKNGRGAGTELCDLLVVFGDHIVMFSDKHCQFNESIDVGVAWRRWYSSAIEKSCRQLEGAEKFVKHHPRRLYLDPLCTVPFPISLPQPERAIFHLVAVTRGGHKAGERFFGMGSSGTPILCTTLVGNDHYAVPFHIGYPLPSKRFVHVLDEMAVDVLLGELDTAKDLVDYLSAKEAYITARPWVNLAGEEDLLARYMMSETAGRRGLALDHGGEEDVMVLEEGDWFGYRNGPEQVGRRFANAESYLWDEIIEWHSSHVQLGVAATAEQVIGESDFSSDHELVLRAMASESRLARRLLVEQLMAVLVQDVAPGQARTRLVSIDKQRGYVFMAATPETGATYQEYRAERARHARAYVLGFAARLPLLREVVCIVSEPGGQPGTQDMLYVRLGDTLSAGEIEAFAELALSRGILRPDTPVVLDGRPRHDFPVKFEITYPPVKVVACMAGATQSRKRRGDCRSAAKRRKQTRAAKRR